MKKQSTNVIAFIVALCIIAGLVFVAVFGIGDFMPGVFEEGGVTKGLDLVGGSYIVYEADIEGTPSAEDMVTFKSMMRNKLDSLGYTEATVALSGDNRISIEIPSITNPEEAVQKLGTTAVLMFCDVDGTVWLEGSDIDFATAAYGPTNETGIPSHYVSLRIKDESVSKFAAATESVSSRTDGNNVLFIVLDDEIISYPSVEQRINAADVIISGQGFTQNETTWLADLISAGQLPFALKEVQLESVGPTLGEKALNTSLIAGAIGLIFVMVFMIVFYKLPGIVASIALIAYSAIMGIILVLGNSFINLSLPGIAGIILSIGMAVDANVVIFERIKEELRNGRSVGAAFTGGFKRAYTAVIDSNVTTLIAAAVLWYFGTGTVKGFAITLFIGVVLSLVSAVLITRFLLARLIGMKIVNKKFYGA
ncbi:MAG: protein translocase subunit SecD [Clostridia bacterium]|nr:protein translocase subunit SecD [Clostridia bacterium]